MVKPGRANAVPQFKSTLAVETDDFSTCDKLNEDQVLQNLYLRLAKDTPFTKLGDRFLLFANPNKPSNAVFSENNSKEYAKNAKTFPREAVLPPHIFDLTASAYNHMLLNGQDQSVLLCGESGSGKTLSHKMITRQLCDLSKSSKKKSRVHSSVLKVDSVLSAFGNATTSLNTNTSFHARYTEYQFDAEGKMIGAKYITFLLDKSRLTQSYIDDKDSRNFSIFYQMLAGITSEEKQLWSLNEKPDHFHYLNHSKQSSSLTSTDSEAFEQLRDNLKNLGIGRRQQSQVFQLLSAILHLGNITFVNDNTSNESCAIKNVAQLQTTADLLGIEPSALETVLTSRSRLVRRDLISEFLDADAAVEQRDSLARSLYAIASTWIVDQINKKLCKEDSEWKNFIAVLDMPGLAGADQQPELNDLHRLLVNYANTRLFSFVDQLFGNDVSTSSFEREGFGPFARLFSNSTVALQLLDPSVENATGNKKYNSYDNGGLLQILDDLCISASSSNGPVQEDVLNAITRECSSSSAFLSTASEAQSFSIRHHKGCIVEYSVEGLCKSNYDLVQDDFVGMVKGDGSGEMAGSINGFFRSLVKADKTVDSSQANGPTRVGDQVKRRPSMKGRRKGGDKKDRKPSVNTVSSLCRSTLSDIYSCLNETRPWVIFHLQPSLLDEKFDIESLRLQMQAVDIPFFAMAPSVVYPSSYIFTEFITKYEKCLNFEFQNTNKQSFMLGMDTGNPRLTIERALRDGKGWNSERDVKVGMSKVFISEKVWTALEESLKEFNLRASVAGTDLYSQSQHRQHVRGSSMTLPGGSDMFDDAASYFSDADSHYESEYEFDNGSTRGSAAKIRNNKDDIESGGTTGMSVVATPSPILKKSAAPAPVKNSRSRRNWLCCVWFSTWWIPSIFLSCCGKMKRKDQQIAWREKVTLCLIIFLLCAFILFFIIGLGWVLCPPKFVLSAGQVGSFNSINSKPPLVYMYGTYYDMTSIINSHVNQNQVMTASAFEQTVLGQDVSQMFDKQAIWTASGGSSVCQYKKPNQFDLFSGKQIPTNWLDHERQLSPNNQNFFSQLSVKGTIVWDRPAMQQFLKNNPQGRLVVAYDKVYDISGFFTSGYTGQNFLGDTTQFQSSVTTIFTKYGSTPWNDATNDFQTLKNFDVNQFNKVMQCMNNMMYVGAVDHRNDLQCVIPNYILLLASAILVAVIGFKFLAALQLGSKRAPEYHEKFVICQVPCYTEGEVSLSRTLNSLALSDYDDKRKLIFVICDGMIIGTGNDRPTPRIVLDLLGVDPLADPDALSFQSLGEGNKQLNMGKVYSGLYEYEGRAVPFVVVVKVGTSSERNRPGNRGKRDSQLLLMRFLSRVHFNQPLAPLELEMYHQIKNVIGVDPAFYEFVLMVDADTEVVKDSLNRLVSCMIRDSKIIGLCGETQISNEKATWVTMIQVYEYFISHHLAKSFESLFGSVTCLPGCFCMYRIRTPIKNQPVLVAPGVIADYSENNVNTLHLKNLLHLGEDRYLSTLMMKHFPNFKLSFTPDAKALTVSPEKWSVIISQRRRWINSTVHNLLELVYLPELCGFCCFSMRFVVFIDLFATVVQPAALLYIGYLIFLAIWSPTINAFPLISLIMIGCVYGFQIIIFLLKREWQHIGWMIIYIFAIPVFSFWLPLYAFWHFDDFSWGSTRRVVGENNKSVYVPEVEEFDPASIPLKRWTDFEQENMDKAETASYISHETSSIKSGRGARYRGTDSNYSAVYASSSYAASSAYDDAPPYTSSPHQLSYPNVSSPLMYPSGSPSSGGITPQFSSPGGGISPVPQMPLLMDYSSGGNRNSYVSFGAAAGGGNGGEVGTPSSHMETESITSSSVVGVVPSDEEILAEIRQILSTADLMAVTKKSVREQLSRIFKVDLSMKKEYIHRCIDNVLKGAI